MKSSQNAGLGTNSGARAGKGGGGWGVGRDGMGAVQSGGACFCIHPKLQSECRRAEMDWTRQTTRVVASFFLVTRRAIVHT